MRRPLPVRCNSVVSHKANLKIPRIAEPRRVARQTAAAVEVAFRTSGGHSSGGSPSVPLTAHPAPAKKNRSRDGDRDRDRDRAALLARLNSAVAPKSSLSIRNRHDCVGNGYCSNDVCSSEARQTERQPHGSPIRATAGLTASHPDYGKVWIGDRSGLHSAGHKIAHHGEDITTAPRRSLGRSMARYSCTVV